MHYKFSIVLLLVTILYSCNENSEDPELVEEYIIFGHFYGHCVGEQCIEIFKLTDSALFEDKSDAYPRSDTAFVGEFKEIDDSKFQMVKSLADDIPTELLVEKNGVIGSPDYSDGGGVYFSIKTGEGMRYWLIDQFDHNIPEYLRPFKAQINSSIALINN